jgi:hypothetical protein
MAVTALLGRLRKEVRTKEDHVAFNCFPWTAPHQQGTITRQGGSGEKAAGEGKTEGEGEMKSVVSERRQERKQERVQGTARKRGSRE